MPINTIPNPQREYLGDAETNPIQNAIARIIYSIGKTGNPNALYGLSTFGIFFRNTNIPRIVST